MGVHISVNNSKLGMIPSVNLPPVVTCRHDAPCYEGCYARKGRFNFTKVKETMTRNLVLYETDPDAYFDGIKTFIDGIVIYKYFRWHAAGDIPDYNYLKRMVKLAREVEETQFLAFTKKFDLINTYMFLNGSMPPNLHIVFSAWDKDFVVDNPYNFPVAYVNFKNKEKNPPIPLTARECSGDCTNCLGCWDIGHGECVAFHQH